jgi:hypothetical protein
MMCTVNNLICFNVNKTIISENKYTCDEFYTVSLLHEHELSSHNLNLYSKTWL